MPVCLACNNTFESSRPWQKFCDEKCRNNYNNDKRLRATQDETLPVIKCPHCLTDDFRMFEKLDSVTYLCNVCSKEFKEGTK